MQDNPFSFSSFDAGDGDIFADMPAKGKKKKNKSKSKSKQKSEGFRAQPGDLTGGSMQPEAEENPFALGEAEENPFSFASFKSDPAVANHPASIPKKESDSATQRPLGSGPIVGTGTDDDSELSSDNDDLGTTSIAPTMTSQSSLGNGGSNIVSGGDDDLSSDSDDAGVGLPRPKAALSAVGGASSSGAVEGGGSMAARIKRRVALLKEQLEVCH